MISRFLYTYTHLGQGTNSLHLMLRNVELIVLTKMFDKLLSDDDDGAKDNNDDEVSDLHSEVVHLLLLLFRFVVHLPLSK